VWHIETRALDSHGGSVQDPFRRGSNAWLETDFGWHLEIFGIGNIIKTVLDLIHVILLPF